MLFLYLATLRLFKLYNWIRRQVNDTVISDTLRTFPCEISVEKFRRVFEKSGERPYNW